LELKKVVSLGKEERTDEEPQNIPGERKTPGKETLTLKRKRLK